MITTKLVITDKQSISTMTYCFFIFLRLLAGKLAQAKTESTALSIKFDFPFGSTWSEVQF